LETLRQAHYAANDAVNVAQGALYESSADVGKLEAEIRFVVEGRRRVDLRLAQLQEQTAQWAERQEQATLEGEALSEQLWGAQEQEELLAAQLEDQATQLPALEDAHRQAQSQASAQRQAVVAVQQALGVLAAEQRSLDDQSRQLNLRRDRLGSERTALAVPDESRLEQLRSQQATATEDHELAQARLDEWQGQLPVLDDERRQRQAQLNTEQATVARLSAKLDALRALQDKVQASGKLQPWLVRQGLDALVPLWKRLHIQPGWEPALEAALRERMGALEVGQLERLQALSSDAPPSRLAFFSPPPVAAAPAPGAWPRLADWLQLADAGLRTLLGDWLHGCYTQTSLEQALAQRGQLQPGEAIFTPQGHAVSRHAVQFYAADSEQAGLRARAQEIEHLDKEVRAHSVIADEARTALARAEAACADAAQRVATCRQQATEAQARSHSVQVELLRLSGLVEQARQRSQQLADDQAEVDAQLEDLQERRIAAEARFEELDMQLADAQESHAQREDRVADAERRLAQAREQQRALERQAQEASFALRSLQARLAELARAADTAAQQLQGVAQEQERAH
ncbi:MAG: chromosome segregation protein SMC, partial [Burkholderiaceae bacterium]|nr:chromosome segregation protein SMC [Burkholderiaceae bacterium]